jgi:tRNA nucleotidyltransferase (CCA-adding enzyme)
MPDYNYLLENRLSAAQQNALRLVRDAARSAGMTVFLAGGAVRDMTSGFPVRDLDFSVQGNALKLKKSLEKGGAHLWGEHEPSRTLFYWFPGSVRVEVSSCRREEYPKPGKPVYHWAPILDDLRRRDFTANAMAISLNEGSWGLLLDPLNGFADIELRHLRLANNYGFIEDPSRMVRAVRLAVRTGWEMEARTKQRYENAKAEGVIDQISPYLRGYELEEIGHEEDPLKVLRALEAEGWMKVLCPAWTSARADAKGLEELTQIYVKLLMLGVNADTSAAHMELLTAKMPPKDLASLKRAFPRHGFVEQWNGLEKSARDFSKELLGKGATPPSATWKLLTSYSPEAVLWLAYSSKNAQVREKFNNFFSVWPEARQKIPVALMAEMRITPDLPEYGNVAEALFFQFMDSKLQTDEEIRAFLQPFSPPAPPPPVVIRRTRRRAEPKIEEEEEDIEIPAGAAGDEEDHDEDEEHEPEYPEKLPPAPKAVKAGPAKGGKEAAKPAAKTGKAEAKAAAKPEAKAPEKAAVEIEAKPTGKAAKPEAKPAAKPAPKPAAKPKSPAPVAKKAARPVAKPAPKKQAAVRKPVKLSKVVARPTAKKSARPSKPAKHDQKKKKR